MSELNDYEKAVRTLGDAQPVMFRKLQEQWHNESIKENERRSLRMSGQVSGHAANFVIKDARGI